METAGSKRSYLQNIAGKWCFEWRLLLSILCAPRLCYSQTAATSGRLSSVGNPHHDSLHEQSVPPHLQKFQFGARPSPDQLLQCHFSISANYTQLPFTIFFLLLFNFVPFFSRLELFLHFLKIFLSIQFFLALFTSVHSHSWLFFVHLFSCFIVLSFLPFVLFFSFLHACLLSCLFARLLPCFPGVGIPGIATVTIDLFQFCSSRTLLLYFVLLWEAWMWVCTCMCISPKTERLCVWKVCAFVCAHACVHHIFADFVWLFY